VRWALVATIACGSPPSTPAPSPLPAPPPAVVADAARDPVAVAPPDEPATRELAPPPADSLGRDPLRELEGDDPIERHTASVAITAVDPVATTTLRPDIVQAKVTAAYVPGIKRCYLRLLAANPAATGLVSIRVHVRDTGHLGPELFVTAFAPALEPCIARMATMWRFPIPHDDAGNPTDAGFVITLALAPRR
jgi:hypothetical protein